jgi:hypothetical protein
VTLEDFDDRDGGGVGEGLDTREGLDAVAGVNARGDGVVEAVAFVEASSIGKLQGFCVRPVLVG